MDGTVGATAQPLSERGVLAPARPATLQETCDDHRLACHNLEKATRDLLDDRMFRGEAAFPGQHREVKAQIMLAVRHLEDARMRFGKVLQYADDGVSILDKMPQQQANVPTAPRSETEPEPCPEPEAPVCPPQPETEPEQAQVGRPFHGTCDEPDKAA